MAIEIWTLDFETYFTADYKMGHGKMTTEEYIRDKRFKAHGCGVRAPDGSYFWVTRNKLREFFSLIKWDNVAVLCQHGQFEGLILSFHYGVKPRMFIDILSMGNLVLQHHSKSLDNMARYFDLPPKTVPYDLFIGREELPQHVEDAVAEGCLHDVRLTWAIFMRMLRGVPEKRIPPFPRGELEVIDITIKMYSDPSLNIDVDRALALSERILARKERALEKIYDWIMTTSHAPLVSGWPALSKAERMRKALRSRDTFAAILTEMGEEVPMKPKTGQNVKPGDMTYAFAKNDAGMKELLESDNEWLAALADTKLQVASTINETRAKRFADTAIRGQPVPIYLHYNSTFSGRTSGGDKMNWGNLERLPNIVKYADGTKGYELGDDGAIKKGEIRLCVVAPPGKKIVVVDLSQIEARMLAWHAGQQDIIEAFRAEKDIYSEFIEPYYGYKVSKETPSERGVGKQLILSCGYQSGAKTIKTTAALGSYGPPVYLTLDEAERLKNYYRTKNYMIAGRGNHWDKAQEIISFLAEGKDYDWGPVKVHDRRIWLPNGCFLDYSDLARLPASDNDLPGRPNWALMTRRGYTRLYGGKITAHVNSALARVVMTEAMRVIAQRYKIALTVYDEIVACVDDDEAKEALAFMVEVMQSVPAWGDGLPIKAEGHISGVYDK